MPFSLASMPDSFKVSLASAVQGTMQMVKAIGRTPAGQTVSVPLTDLEDNTVFIASMMVLMVRPRRQSSVQGRSRKTPSRG